MRDIELNIEELPIASLKPYDNNAKKHTHKQIDAIESSIKEFGFRNPAIVWRNEDGIPEVVAGHARITTAKKLGMKTVPCISCDDLTDAQRRALTLVDNQTTMMTGWDEDLLNYELDVLCGEFNMEDFGFSSSVDFSDLDSMAEITEEYEEFVKKFKPKKTTDDCYTPPEVFEAVKNWVCSRYEIDESKIIRPFYPGGDYRHEDYTGKVVIDNPPFSIFTEICRYYIEKEIPFFLFCPSLTAFSSFLPMSFIFIGCNVTYENEAIVHTSFATNLEKDVLAMTAPDLQKVINETQEGGKSLRKLEYPPQVITASTMIKLARADFPFIIKKNEAVFIRKLDCQKDSAIYGAGLLVSEKVADKRVSAEKAVSEKQVTEKQKEVCSLSDRELEIVRSLSD